MTTRRRLQRPYPPPAVSFRRDEDVRRDEPWELAVTGDLSDKQADVLSRLVEVPRNSRGTIFFDTGGGSVYAGLALASIIRLRGLDVDGVVAGECSSAALLPFAACHRRFVTPHSTLLFHPVRWQSDEEVRYEEAAEWARHFQLMEQDIDRLLARMFGISPEQLTRWTRPGRFLTGPELVEAGLAEQVDLFSGDLWQQVKDTQRKKPAEAPSD